MNVYTARSVVLSLIYYIVKADTHTYTPRCPVQIEAFRFLFIKKCGDIEKKNLIIIFQLSLRIDSIYIRL